MTSRHFSILLCCAVCGCGVKGKEEDKPPPHAVEWKGIAEVILREWTELLGTVQPLPENIVRISAPIEGRVVAVLPGVAEGQQVQANTVLVQLDAGISQANADKAKAMKDVAEQEEKQARSAVTLAEKKFGSLIDVPNIPELQKEEARLGAEDARFKLIAAEKRFLAADKDAKTAADQVQLYSLKTTLAGRLDRVLVSKGQTIASGTVVAEVADVEKEVDVLCFVSLNVVQKLDKGQKAEIGGVAQANISAQPAGPKGRIVFIAERADPDTGNFAVKVRFPNSENATEKLRPNTSLRIRILTRRESALSIPEAALLEDTDPPSVIVVESQVEKDKSGKEETTYTARRLQATTGLRDRVQGMVEIRELKDPENKWKGDLKDALFVTTKNQGLQTGDVLKQEEEEEGK